MVSAAPYAALTSLRSMVFQWYAVTVGKASQRKRKSSISWQRMKKFIDKLNS